MSYHPVALVIALALLTSVALSGCDRISNLTEQEHIQRAKDYEYQGNLNGGIIELKNALQKNPNNAQARLLLGQIYLKSGRAAEAEKELSQAQKLGVNAESIMPLLGEALLLMGENQRVLDEVQLGEQTSPTNRARILQLRANALLKQGKIGVACNLFQQALDTGAKHPEIYWGLTNCAIAERNTDKAEEWLDAALRLNTKQAKTWTYKGDLDRLRNNAQGALNAYTNALKSEPNNLEALERRTDTYLTLGQLEPAQKDLNHLLQIAPKSLSTNHLKAAINFQQKKYAEARDALQEVFKIAPNHLPSIFLAGKTAYALGDYQQAETYLYRILAKTPGHAPTRKILASIQIKQNKFDKAQKTLSPLLASNTQDSKILALAGETALMAQDYPKAMNYFNQALALDPQSVSIRSRLAAVRLVEGDVSEALSDLELASAQNPKPSEADFALVMLHLQRKEYDKALLAISALEKKLPNNPVTHNLRAGALIGKKDRAGARKAFEQALVIQPNFIPAISNLAQLDLMDGLPKNARKRYEGILKTEPNNLEAMLALANINLRAKDEKSYLRWIEKAIKAHPKALQPNIAMTQYLVAKGETNKALSVARAFVNSNPDNVEALNLLGSIQLAAGDSSNAITTFATLTKKSGQSPDAYLKLALAQIADKKLSIARSTLHKALQIKPDHLQSQEALIYLEMSDRKPETAMKIARQIQLDRPQSPMGFERQADILLAQKDFSQAIKALEKALSHGAGSSALIKLHQAHVYTANSKLSALRLENWLKQNPLDNTVRAHLAEYLMDSGRNKDAIAHYLEILKQKPNNVAVLNNLATLYQRGNDQRALFTAEQAFKLMPNDPAVQDTLGWILVERGQAQRGLELLRKALFKAPGNAAIRYHHAVALANTGEKNQARKELAKLLKDTPEFPESKAAMMLLKSL